MMKRTSLREQWQTLRRCTRDTWNSLVRSIFVGSRYEKSMRGMSVISLLVVAIGTVMSVMNIVQRYYSTLIVSLCIVAGGGLMAYFVIVAKKRRAASVSALLFAIGVFTHVTLAGTMNGFAILWTTLIPLIMCYFFTVRFGILLFVYFETLFCILFYTPLRSVVEPFYSETFMNRYPILYLSLGVITSIFMIRYHKSILDQMDNAERLQKSMEEAERSNAAKSDFLANMSHEIRTPINAVLGMNEMVLRESLHGRDQLPEEREAVRKMFAEIGAYAGNIESAGHGLLAIINDILDFSKIEAGRLEIVESEYQLSSVLNDVSNMITFRAKDKGLAFRAEVDGTLPDGLYGDEVRVRQVITNILTNAVKYTREGSVTLSVGREPDSAEDNSRIRLRIAVRDTGIGIRKEDIDKLFTKFERVDLRANSTVEGTGLGLAITRRLLDMMGGSIDVESVYGEGSVFTIHLPQRITSSEPVGNFRERFEQSMREMQAYEGSFRAPSARILAVDDTRMNLSVVAGLLKSTGIRVDTAPGGAEALELTGLNRYDLILMDQRMPGMDGTEAMRRIREQPDGANRETPIICLTADAISGARERYLAEGFTDYLTKPIDSRALEKMLIRYLPEGLVLPGEAAERPPEPETAEGGEDAFAPLRAEGMDPESGLGYCQNDAALYRTILTEFVQSADQKCRDLRRSYAEKDWSNYGIQVHALKSTSKMIGAASLSESAARLEAASARGDEKMLREEHDGMMGMYEAAVEAIRALPGIEEGPEDTDGDILEFLPE